jgi:hypothetical protein
MKRSTVPSLPLQAPCYTNHSHLSDTLAGTRCLFVEQNVMLRCSFRCEFTTDIVMILVSLHCAAYV